MIHRLKDTVKTHPFLSCFMTTLLVHGQFCYLFFVAHAFLLVGHKDNNERLVEFFFPTPPPPLSL